MALVWSECGASDPWTLKRTTLSAGGDDWSDPWTIEAGNDPRFPSAAYDRQGKLWVAYSVETSTGREVVARQVTENR